MRKTVLLVTLLVSAVMMMVQTPARAEESLPVEFLDAAPKVQLYMAYAQFKMANHAMARRMWERIGGAGAAEAAFNLGIVYQQGLGVEPDSRHAAALYRQAAQQGSRAGAYQLGLMHFSQPALVARSEAEHWLSVAALDGDEDAGALLNQLLNRAGEQDPLINVRLKLAAGDTDAALTQLQRLIQQAPPEARALTLLAWLHETGLGVEQDIGRAGQLFRQAAEGGDAEAQYALAVMLETGVGQPQDRQAAKRWLQRSAAQGYQRAMDKLNAP